MTFINEKEEIKKTFNIILESAQYTERIIKAKAKKKGFKYIKLKKGFHTIYKVTDQTTKITASIRL